MQVMVNDKAFLFNYWKTVGRPESPALCECEPILSTSPAAGSSSDGLRATSKSLSSPFSPLKVICQSFVDLKHSKDDLDNLTRFNVDVDAPSSRKYVNYQPLSLKMNISTLDEHVKMQYRF